MDPFPALDRRTFLLASFAGAVASPVAAADRPELPFRQVHLDFHTSELIPDLAVDFNAQQFVATLQSARVNSINVFAKCHHGWAYYDTKIAARHPKLKIDLLGEMVRACRPAGIAVNYYYSLVWDVLQARQHPEWRMLDAKGRFIPDPPGAAWPWMCMNSPYFDKVVAENREILEKYETNGAFFDILKQPPEGCFCRWCKAERQQLRLSDSSADVFRHNKIVSIRVERKLCELIRARFPNAATFFNSRAVIGMRDELDWYSHIEIESLPTGGWGYSHFQQRVRYMRTLGKDMVGMTGRFHKSWGDFGGLKNQAALDYECLNFLANGTKVCIGDQLHPRGRLDAATYSRIGKTLRRVEALEPWARGAKALADIGVISTAATNPDMTTQKIPLVDQGFTNMLLELHQQFDVLDAESDFSRYELLIVPDEIRPVPELVARLEKFRAAGGALIVSGESLLDAEQKRFALRDMGVRYLGPAKFRNEYILLRPDRFPGVEDQPYFLYQAGLAVAAEPKTEVLATYGHPYFDRSPEHFSSHKQTPLGERSSEPLITAYNRLIYIANPFFRSYAVDGYGVQKLVIGELIRKLLGRPAIVAADLPSTAQLTVLEQPFTGGTRKIVHLLYYPLTRRAPDIDIIEEPGLLTEVKLRLRVKQRATRVSLAPQARSLPFHHEGQYVLFEVPRVLGHQAVVVE